MNTISYFKLQAKNLYHDIKLDFMQDDENYICAPRFFDVNAIIGAFDIDVENFSLMKAQHIIAKMVGMDSWKELISANDALLSEKKAQLDNHRFKMKRRPVTNIDLSQYERIDEGTSGDYLLKCPRLPELEEIIKREPDSMCLSCLSDLEADQVEKIFGDTEHIYVNVIPQWRCIRVLVPKKKYPDNYAVQVDYIKVV